MPQGGSPSRGILGTGYPAPSVWTPPLPSLPLTASATVRRLGH